MIKAKKGKISSSDGTVSAVIDDMPVQFEGSTYSSTVRTTKCEILCTTVKCSACTKYRASLPCIIEVVKKYLLSVLIPAVHLLMNDI